MTSTAACRSLLCLLLSAASLASEDPRDQRERRDVRDARLGFAPWPQQLINLLATLPPGATQCTGSLAGFTVARVGVRSCVNSIGAMNGTQLITSPEAFDDTGVWTPAADGSVPIVTANAAIAPDGTMTAEQVQYLVAVPSGGSWDDVRGSVSTTVNGPYTFSLSAKAGTSNLVNLRLFATGGGGQAASAACSLTSSWSRCSVSITSTGSITAVGFRVGNDGSGPSAMPSGTVFLAGALLERTASASTFHWASEPAPVVKLTTNQLAVEGDGILIERGATNLLLRSEALGTTWTVVGNSVNPVVGNSVAGAPDLTSTSSRIVHQQNVDNTGNTYSLVRQSVGSLTNGGTYTATLFGQNGDVPTNPTWYINDGASTAGLTFTSCSFATGSWSTCAVTQTIRATTVFPSFGYFNFNASVSGKTLYAWGTQLETGGYPHAYVPTTTASASSADDIVSMANPLSGALVGFCMGATYKPTYGRTWESRSGNIALFQLGTQGTNGSLEVHRDTSNKVVAVIQDAAGTTRTATSASTAWTGTGSHRATACYSPGFVTLYLDGTLDASVYTGAGTGIIGALPASFVLGYRGAAGAGSAEALDGHVSAVCVDPRPAHCL